jgi:hypothetical protein
MQQTAAAAAGASGASASAGVAAAATETLAQAAARLRATLPPEPGAGEPYTRVQVRLPSTPPVAGTAAGPALPPAQLQKQRRFKPTDSVQALLSWCELAWLDAYHAAATSPEAAAVAPAASSAAVPVTALRVSPFQLVVAAVHKTFAPGVGGEQTLADAGLVPSAAVILRPV